MQIDSSLKEKIIKEEIKRIIKKVWLSSPRMTEKEFLKLVTEAWGEHSFNEYSK